MQYIELHKVEAIELARTIIAQFRTAQCHCVLDLMVQIKALIEGFYRTTFLILDL
jgi:hypothetical protein